MRLRGWGYCHCVLVHELIQSMDCAHRPFFKEREYQVLG